MRSAVIAFAALVLVPPAWGDRISASELQSTRIVYASGQRFAARPAVAPGRAGELRIVRATGDRGGRGHFRHFSVAVEGGLPIDAAEFARAVEAILADERGWRAAGVRFRRVSSNDVDFHVVLASPALTDGLCAPLQTNGRYSCATGSTAVVNYKRWVSGAETYGARLARYRTYVVNHEVGHLLGHGHAVCARAGAPAPVMVQQTKGVAPCRPNPWPLASEVD